MIKFVVLQCICVSFAVCLRQPQPQPRFVSAVKPYIDDPRFPEDEPDTHDTTLEVARNLTDAQGMPHEGPNGGFQWTDRLLVWPDQKFAFCWVDKNAGTQFNLLMNHLNKKQGSWWQSSWSNFDHSWEDIDRTKGWRFGIFFRDPAERFLSAWSSKCQAMEEGGWNCLGPRNVPKDTPDAVNYFEQATSQLPAYMAHVKQKGYFNSHYDPQNTFCGARKLMEYDFVGHLTGDYEKVHSQVHDMFSQVAKVPQEDSSFWMYLSKLFPPHSAAGHASHASGKLQLFYRSPAIYSKVTDAYEDDYKKLHLKRGHYEP